MSTSTTETTTTNKIMDETNANTSNNNKDSIKMDMWENKWSTGSTNWHRLEPNESLVKFQSELLPTENHQKATVLVPLCGKSVDLVYLAKLQDHVEQVVGVEGVAKAVEEFASENADLELTKQESGNNNENNDKSPLFTQWSGKHISMLQGDFFQLPSHYQNNDKNNNGRLFNAVWDRASLIAIEPEMRKTYVDTIGKTVAPKGRILLSTFFAKGRTTGPPYSIDESDVRELFEPLDWVESVKLLSDHDALALEPWYKSIIMWLMLGNVREKVFLIQAK